MYRPPSDNVLIIQIWHRIPPTPLMDENSIVQGGKRRCITPLAKGGRGVKELDW